MLLSQLVASLLITQVALSVTPLPPVVPAAPPALRPVAAGCRYPAQVINLNNWKLTLPVGRSGDERNAQEVRQPQLSTYAQMPDFVADPRCYAVMFRAPVNGATTSGSKYPRAELREMADNGRASASWSSKSGVHRVSATLAFLALPSGKPHVVGLQVRGPKDDVSGFRLEGTKLWITNGDQIHYKLVTDRYRLGTVFQAGFEVSNGVIRAYVDGVQQTALKKSFTGGYFKAGAYTQANCSNSQPCDSGNYGATAIYRLDVSHQFSPREWAVMSEPDHPDFEPERPNA
jgi:hypothetical protein